MQMEYKTLPFELQELDDTGVFWGYASVFGNVDSYNEIVDRGAFRKSLQEYPNTRLCHQHDWKEVIGKPVELREDERGLYVKAQLVLDVQRAREDYALMKAGALGELSIGYRVMKDAHDEVDGRKVRRLKELWLFEISVVTIAANNQAQILGVKERIEPEPSVPVEELPPDVEPTTAEQEATPLTVRLTARERLELYTLSRKYLEA